MLPLKIWWGKYEHTPCITVVGGKSEHAQCKTVTVDKIMPLEKLWLGQ